MKILSIYRTGGESIDDSFASFTFLFFKTVRMLARKRSVEKAFCVASVSAERAALQVLINQNEALQTLRGHRQQFNCLWRGGGVAWIILLHRINTECLV